VHKLFIFQHALRDHAGSIIEWAELRGWRLHIVRVDKGETLPAPSEIQNLLILGGPMNIYQHRDCPWLVPEKQLIDQCIERGSAIFGICLGGQLLADALGAKVSQNQFEEIGWFPVNFTPEATVFFPQLTGSLTVLHWHGDTFTLPQNAVRLAYSNGCPEQGFLWKDKVLGLQFHPEVCSASAEIESDFKPSSGPFVQDLPTLLEGYNIHAPKVKEVFFGLMDFLFLRSRS
jgi:GMP synthase (glutamine-hydrolysing)